MANKAKEAFDAAIAAGASPAEAYQAMMATGDKKESHWYDKPKEATTAVALGPYGYVGKKVYDYAKDKNKSAAEKQGRAQDKATKAQLKEADAARQFLRDQAEKGRTDISQGAASGSRILELMAGRAEGDLASGYRRAGADLDRGQNTIESLMGNGLAQSYQSDPGYQARVQQGGNALSRYAGNAGLSGDNIAALMGLNQDMGTQEFQNYQNRQTGLGSQIAGMDSQRADMGAQFGTNLANMDSGIGSQLAQLYTGQGTANANLGIGAAGQNNQIAQSIMNAQQAPVQYAGGQQAAQAAGIGNAVRLAGSTAAMISDERAKKDITPADELIDEALSVLKPYSYGYFDEKHGKGRFVGILAQDAEKSQAGQWMVEDGPEGKSIDMRKALGLVLAAAAYERKKRIGLEHRLARLEQSMGAK